MEVSSTRPGAIARGRGSRGRPAQALYMPPARRHRDPRVTHSVETKCEIKESSEHKIMEDAAIESPQILVQEIHDLNISDNSIKDITNKCMTSPLHRNDSQIDAKQTPVVNAHDAQENVQEKWKKLDEIGKTPIVILSAQENNKPVQILQIADKEKGREREEGKKRDELKLKTRNTKGMDVKCDVLQISLAKNIKKSPIKLVEVDQWEDLINSDEEPTSPDRTVQKNKAVIPKYDENDPDEYENIKNDETEHIVEIYDFPSTFKTPDIMQIYNEMDQESMYIKWINDTRALLVLGSAMQAKRALGIENPFIKSRPAAMGSHMALEAVRSSNLRPAMKRPQTSMQAARRMITTALGAKSNVSREVQQRERDALKKAKEEKRNQRQSERDAWEGNPRPTTA